MFEEVERPEKNKRSLKDDMPWGAELETALLKTIQTGKAIKLALADFHSSPAKGRLWKLGYSVRHRVIDGFAYAWLEVQPVSEEALDS